MDLLTRLVCDPPTTVLASERPTVTRALLDTLGCIAAARQAESVLAIRGATADLVGRTVANWPADRQALVFGAAAHALDFDDVLETANAHASAVLAPAALTVAATEGMSIDDLCDGFTVGYVVFHVLGRMMNPGHYLSGWHATSTLGVVAAAATVSRLLRLQPTSTTNALSLAMSMAGGLKSQFGYGAKHLHPGNAAANGIVAGYYARRGLTGNPGMLDEPRAFSDAYNGEGAKVVSAADEWKVGVPSSQIWFKYYPSCSSTHRPLAAATALLTGRADVKQAESIEVAIAPIARRSLIFQYPSDSNQARFSLEFCLSSLLVTGGLTLDSFGPRRLIDDDIRRVAARINVIEDETLSSSVERPERARIRATFQTGETLTKSCAYPPGHPRSSAFDQQIWDKFMQCLKFGQVTNYSSILRPLYLGTQIDVDSMLWTCQAWFDD